MRRRALVYLLIPAVLVAAAALAYYSYRYSSAVASRERRAILDATRELAEEKVLNIEADLEQSDRAIFDSVDIENLMSSQQKLSDDRPAVESVHVLDSDWNIVPDGAFTRRRAPAAVQRFRELFKTVVIPDLQALDVGLGERAHLHATYDRRPYLFAITKKVSGGEVYYVVVEADLTYLVATVFPEYFGMRSSRLYQVVDANGDIIYGFAFQGVPDEHVVEWPFAKTVSDWKLRVAQREKDLLSAPDPRPLFDVVLIGSAVAVIVAGLAVFLLAARRAQRANDLKSEFISNVSHELKTPLSIINMFGEMLAMQRAKSPEQATEYANIITRESRRLTRLIENVLDFARIERGAEIYDFQEGNLAEVVDRSLDIYRHRLERDDIELSVETEPDLPPVRLDENAMTLLLLNLVDNAIKYAGSGGRIEVGLSRRERGVALSVRDFGPGIPGEEHDKIFERFYRSRSVRLKTARGSGIGLSLVKHIAEAHGGRVTVDSEVGKGTTFTVWIPPVALG